MAGQLVSKRKKRVWITKQCLACGSNYSCTECSGRSYCGRACSNKNAKHNRTHGESNTALFDVWSGMKSRCFNKNNKAYSHYGERGIVVCDEWMIFGAFRAWSYENGYERGLQVDRINVDGNYEPGNCRFVNRYQQAANRRKRCDAKTSIYKGVSFSANKKKWLCQVTSKGRHMSVGSYDTELEAANAYDTFAKSEFGEFACLNFRGQ